MVAGGGTVATQGRVFAFGELEGKAIGGVQGPVTFGEIAYQLLNQTMVMIRIN